LVYGQVTRLLARDPAANVSLDADLATDSRLDHLREVVKLLRRLPTGLFGLFLKQDDNADKFRFWCEAGGSPGAPWGWENLDLWLLCSSLALFWKPSCGYRLG
jgi:hypothetical protein